MLAVGGFGNELTDELADDFVTGRVGEGTAQFNQLGDCPRTDRFAPEEGF
jgi:hypothetical protein